MTYTEAIAYLTARLPMFTRDGASAFKKDLDNTRRFCRHLGDPQDRFTSVHIAGTNGKGSTSHMLASVLAAAGYRTGLYTSPHLLDFRERIRVDGKMIGEAAVVAFTTENRPFIEAIQPSFFEVTVAMAFDHFAKQNVDIAVVETGLGGRLDSTNVIRPELSVITNIGLDHTNLLGHTLEQIASEKAGIIKQKVPVVVSEKDPAVAQVFAERATILDAPLRFATDEREVRNARRTENGLRLDILEKSTGKQTPWTLDLAGLYQAKNVLGVLAAIDELRKQDWNISHDHIREGLAQVKKHTGLLPMADPVRRSPDHLRYRAQRGRHPRGGRKPAERAARRPALPARRDARQGSGRRAAAVAPRCGLLFLPSGYAPSIARGGTAGESQRIRPPRRGPSHGFGCLGIRESGIPKRRSDLRGRQHVCGGRGAGKFCVTVRKKKNA